MRLVSRVHSPPRWWAPPSKRRVGRRSRAIHPKSVPVGVSSESKRILVADDDEAAVEFIAGVLRSQGAEVETAIGGRRAVETLLDHGERFDLLIIALMMEEADAFEVMIELERSVEFTGKLAFITTHPDSMSRAAALYAKSAGYDYVGTEYKPFRMERLVGLVEG